MSNSSTMNTFTKVFSLQNFVDAIGSLDVGDCILKLKDLLP
jgi:hypothetical protein